MQATVKVPLATRRAILEGRLRELGARLEAIE